MIIKDYVCEAGRKISRKESSKTGFGSYNEDFVEYRDHQYVLVLDGSSGLGPKPEKGFGGKSSPAQWFVQAFAEAVKRNIDGLIPTEKLLKRCIDEVKTEYDKVIETLNGVSAEKQSDENGEKQNSGEIRAEAASGRNGEIMEPSASMALVRKIDGIIEVTVLGDITVGVKTQDGRIRVIERGDVEACDNKVIELINVKKKKTPKRHVSEIVKDADVRALLEENRSRMNSGREDGYLILGFDKRAIELATQESITFIDAYAPNATDAEAAKIIDSMLIMSDGFASHYKKYGRSLGKIESLWLRADFDRLKYIYKDLRREEKGDPYCDKYPRFKKSDDASAVHVHFMSRFYVEDREKQKTTLNVKFFRLKGRVHTARMYLGITRPAVVTLLSVPFALYDFFTGKLFADKAIEDKLMENASSTQSLIHFNWLGVMIFGIALVYLIVSIILKYRKSAGTTVIVDRNEIRESVLEGLRPGDKEEKDGFEIKKFFNGISDEYYMDSAELNRWLQNGGTITYALNKRNYELPEAVKGLVPAIMEKAFSHNRLMYNSRLLRQASHLEPGGKKVMLQPAKYFAGQCSHEIVYKEFILPGGIGKGFAGKELLCDGNKRLIDLDYSMSANFLGASTIVITRDKRIIIGKQAQYSVANKGRFAPSGSGSVDYADIKKARKYFARKTDDRDHKLTFNEILEFAMVREFCEECAYDLKNSMKTMKTRIIGYTRLIERGGKPDYFGLSYIDEDSAVIGKKIEKRERGLVDRLLTIHFDDKDEIIDKLEQFCDRYIYGVDTPEGRIPVKEKRISIQIRLITQYLKDMRKDGKFDEMIDELSGGALMRKNVDEMIDELSDGALMRKNEIEGTDDHPDT